MTPLDNFKETSGQFSAIFEVTKTIVYLVSDLRRLFLGADGAFSVYGWVGVEDLLSQVNEGMVPVADCQALCFEQNAGLPIVRHAQRAIRPHQRLEQLPLTERHPWLMPVKRLWNIQRIIKHKRNKGAAVKLQLKCGKEQLCVLWLSSRGRSDFNVETYQWAVCLDT